MEVRYNTWARRPSQRPEWRTAKTGAGMTTGAVAPNGSRKEPGDMREPRNLDKRHARLIRAAMEGRLNRREVLQRGISLGLAAPALAGLMVMYRGGQASAQGTPTPPVPEMTAPDAMKGKSVDMTILGIAGGRPARSASRWRPTSSNRTPRTRLGMTSTSRSRSRRSISCSRRPRRRSPRSPPSTTSSSRTASG